MLRVAAILPLLVLAGPESGSRHPQDGPDADVRIRIDSQVVRVNVVMNLAFCDGIVGVQREDEDRLHEVEHAALRDALQAFYREHNRVRIDGVTVPPLFPAFEVAEPDLSLLPLFPRMGARALYKIRLVLEYPAKSAPRSVALLWGAFPPDVVLATPDGVPPVSVQAQLLARGSEEVIRFREEEPEHVWHAPSPEAERERFLPVPAAAPRRTLAVPLIATLLLLGVASSGLWLWLAGSFRRARGRWLLAVAAAAGTAFATRDVARVEVPDPFAPGASLPTRDEALRVFRPLHANIYRAFDYAGENDIYEALEQSVDGPLLDELYNQIYRSLIMKEEGGAVSRVDSVETVSAGVEEIGVLPPDGRAGFRVVTRWRVRGVVNHWGHSHSRTNEYHARYTVALTDAGWRIAGNQVLSSRRIEGTPIGPGGGR